MNDVYTYAFNECHKLPKTNTFTGWRMEIGFLTLIPLATEVNNL